MTFANIVVATDFSETSEDALVYGRELARTFHATLHVLHVAGNVMAAAIGVEGFTTDFAALQRDLEEAARKQLDGLISDEDKRTLTVKTVLLTSDSPARSIVAYANDVHADLLVVGTHGWGAMAHFLMGSVAERVVRTASCPVLTIRRPARERESAGADRATAHA